MKFYRYEIRNYASLDYDSDTVSSITKLHLIEFNLVRETPKGYWIAIYYTRGKLQTHAHWIPKESKKRYAYPTRKEALNNFIKRTDRRIRILQNQISDCKMGINLALNIKLP